MPMGTYQQVKDELKKLGIDDYEVVDHPAAHTTEEADRYIAGKEGVRTKTMFLKGKKKKFYMVIMDDKKRMDFHEFQNLTGAKRVSMARPRELFHRSACSTTPLTTSRFTLTRTLSTSRFKPSTPTRILTRSLLRPRTSLSFSRLRAMIRKSLTYRKIKCPGNLELTGYNAL